MKINVEVQYLCVDPKMVRGIPNYIRRLLSAYADSKENKYSVSFFDFERQRKNRELLMQNVGESVFDSLQVIECNSFNYKVFLDHYYNNDWKRYSGERYEDLTHLTFINTRQILLHHTETLY